MESVAEPESKSGAGPQTVIVVPAHNEGAVIERCLSAVLASAQPGEFDVVVVSNGSTDDTATRASRLASTLGYPVQVANIAAASKIAALQHADLMLAAAEYSAYIYLDADVILSTTAARALVAEVACQAARIAHARLDVDLEGASWWIRQYYRTWSELPYVRYQLAGSGVFAVNAAGLSRITPWPDVINDDAYASRCFTDVERGVVDLSFRTFAARSVPALVRRRARLVNGNRQLDEQWPVPCAQPGANTAGALAAAVRSRSVPLVSASTFLLITLAARLLAGWRRLTGSTGTWSTDTTTRLPA